MQREQGYFSFTKKERTGILALAAILIVTAILPRWMPGSLPVAEAVPEIMTYGKERSPGGRSSDYGDKDRIRSGRETDALNAGQSDFRNKDSSYFAGERTGGERKHYHDGGKAGYSPQYLPRAWENKKERFPDDRKTASYSRSAYSRSTDRPSEKAYRYTPRVYQPVDINRADTTALIALPGIGSKLATRIVAFRKKLGGFTNVDQVGQVYGLSDSTFRKILPLLRCASDFKGDG